MGALKSSFPNLECISFDLEEVVKSIKEENKAPGINYVAGTFFDSKTIPKCDAVFLKAILHDWSDE
jgi:hypothetical protein